MCYLIGWRDISHLGHQYNRSTLSQQVYQMIPIHLKLGYSVIHIVNISLIMNTGILYIQSHNWNRVYNALGSILADVV